MPIAGDYGGTPETGLPSEGPCAIIAIRVRVPGMHDTPAVVDADGESLTVAGLVAVARERAPVEVPDPTREAIRTARDRVEEVVESGEPVYGVNTGFGDLVAERIPESDLRTLQSNLLRSHAAGAGDPLAEPVVRAMMLARLNTLAKGYSGVREVVADHLLTLLNERVNPVVYSHGSLGASGDLIPLAHMALVLVGEGEAEIERDGDRVVVEGNEALDAVGLEPLELQAKEGLALINGTQLTVALAALLAWDAAHTVTSADVAGSLTTEVTMSTTATSDPVLHAVRPHDGQQASARNVKRLTANSEIVESHRNCDRVQDPYSIRCLPQVHGAVRDAVDHLRSAVEVELNSATDNPLVFPADAVDERASGTEGAAILSGGNFHGEPLGLRLEYVRTGLTELATVAERRVDRLLNPHVQESHLAPYLTEESGLESGYMLAQYTAASLINEARSQDNAAVDNTPVSGNQEDHVSMSVQSAYNARTALEAARTAVGIELLAATQAASFVDEELSPGMGTGAAMAAVREIAPPLTDDRPLRGEIEAAADLVGADLVDAVGDTLSEPLE